MNPLRTDESQMRTQIKSDMASLDHPTYLARVLDAYADSAGEGFVLELTHGHLTWPDGFDCKPGDRFHCFIRSSDPGDICAYFESAYVSEGTLCRIAPYDTGLARRYVSLPIHMMADRNKS